MLPALMKCECIPKSYGIAMHKKISYRFELIQTCWLQDPKDRPSFDYLKVSITTMLEVISGYLDFSATLTPKTMQENYDHLCPYDQLSRYDKLPEASSCNEL